MNSVVLKTEFHDQQHRQQLTARAEAADKHSPDLLQSHAFRKVPPGQLCAASKAKSLPKQSLSTISSRMLLVAGWRLFQKSPGKQEARRPTKRQQTARQLPSEQES